MLERFNGEGGKKTRRFSREHNATRARREDRPERAIGNPYGAFPSREVGDGIDEGARELRLPSRVPRGPSRVKQERSRGERLDPGRNRVDCRTHAFEHAPLRIEVPLHDRDTRA